jgi:hypothetical protein
MAIPTIVRLDNLLAEVRVVNQLENHYLIKETRWRTFDISMAETQFGR